MRLIIPDIPRSPNGPKGLLRMHWADRSRYYKEWFWHVMGAMDVHYYESRIILDKAKVHIHQIRTKELDPDNLVSSNKPVLDAMVKCNLIKDDNGNCIDLECTQEIGKVKQTIIDIEAV